jgi:hypothetical protein
MKTDHQLSIEAAKEHSHVTEERIRFLVSCAESHPMGSPMREEFNMCIDEVLFWAKRARYIRPVESPKAKLVVPAPPPEVKRIPIVLVNKSA